MQQTHFKPEITRCYDSRRSAEYVSKTAFVALATNLYRAPLKTTVTEVNHIASTLGRKRSKYAKEQRKRLEATSFDTVYLCCTFTRNMFCFSWKVSQLFVTFMFHKEIFWM